MTWLQYIWYSINVMGKKIQMIQHNFFLKKCLAIILNKRLYYYLACKWPSLMHIINFIKHYFLNKKKSNILYICLYFVFYIYRKIFPDPRDGSLYMYMSSHATNDFKKLRYTISELIYHAPLRSEDGVLYTGLYIFVY